MTRKILIAAAIAVVVVVAGWYVGFYRSESSHIKQLRAKQQEAQMSLLLSQDRYLTLLRSKKELPAERVALAKLERLVPDGPELDNIVTTLYAAASAAGVQLSSITSPAPANFSPVSGSSPTSPVKSSGPAELSLTLGVSGTPAEIESLIGNLDSSPRLFVVDNLSLEFGSGSPAATGRSSGVEQSTSLSLRAFYASPNSTNPAS